MIILEIKQIRLLLGGRPILLKDTRMITNLIIITININNNSPILHTVIYKAYTDQHTLIWTCPK